MKKTQWQAYTDLDWTDSIIALPEDYAEETELFVRAIKENSRIETKTLLHLGCGAGGHDYTFKKHFKVTGVDITQEMLEMAQKVNSEIDSICGDMREINLKESFDAVVIPDSIMHMVTLKDLKKTIAAASQHLKPGGVLLIVAHIKEEFRDNKFVYTGAKGDVEITIFENNYIIKPAGTTYEAAVVYLIRRKGKLEIHSDVCTGGLFPLATWLHLFKAQKYNVRQIKLEHTYDRYLMEEGQYILRVFICSKP
ncbi:MAG: methyltransferase domain-containing protein, partial [Candidatus Aminicenantes bacterium]|nr:methyltransferase domain-containing protein [Candidatus Aminicenantes bacterium]